MEQSDSKFKLTLLAMLERPDGFTFFSAFSWPHIQNNWCIKIPANNYQPWLILGNKRPHFSTIQPYLPLHILFPRQCVQQCMHWFQVLWIGGLCLQRAGAEDWSGQACSPLVLMLSQRMKLRPVEWGCIEDVLVNMCSMFGSGVWYFCLCQSQYDTSRCGFGIAPW